MDSPKISVVVPVYNAEHSLRRALDSLAIQRYRNYEVIIVDDGSKDKSGTICDEYAAKFSHFRVFHKDNGGVSSARNIGIDNANGDWITFCDADDYVLPCWLDNYGLESGIRADLICQGMIWGQQDQDPVKINFDNQAAFKGNMSDLADCLIKKNSFGYTQVKLYKKKILSPNNQQTIRFDCQYDFMEDEEFNCRYLINCKTAVVMQGAGYFYIPPKIDKYIVYSSKRIPLYQTLLKNSRQLSGKKCVDAEIKYQHLLVSSLIEMCKEKSFNRDSLLRLRAYVLKEYKDCPLFVISKFIIAIDFTGIVSSIMLQIHLKLKKS